MPRPPLLSLFLAVCSLGAYCRASRSRVPTWNQGMVTAMELMACLCLGTRSLALSGPRDLAFLRCVFFLLMGLLLALV